MFSLNSTKYLSSKGLEPATSCVRDQDETTVPARHMTFTCVFLLQHEEAWEKFYNEFMVHMIKGLEQAGGNK